MPLAPDSMSHLLNHITSHLNKVYDSERFNSTERVVQLLTKRPEINLTGPVLGMICNDCHAGAFLKKSHNVTTRNTPLNASREENY